MDEDTNTGPITNISSGDVSVNGPGMAAVGTGITQTYNADPDLPYKVGGLPNPYLGLRSYDYTDSAIFAGRDGYISDAVAKLTNVAAPLSLLFITGASGSGKSSFAKAGLLPALEQYYAGRGLSAKRAVIRPGSTPTAALFDGLAQLGLAQGVVMDVSTLANPATFAQLLEDKTPTTQVNLLVIDQFEEVFTQAEAGASDALLTLLQSLPPFVANRTHIICTLRVDYLPPLFAYKELYDIARAGVDLRVMSVAELAQAIKKPVQQCCAGKWLEPELVTRLANEAAAGAGLLPLLQVTLEELWNGGLLKLGVYLEKYQNLGNALQQRAEGCV